MNPPNETNQFKVEWIDLEREPKNAPDPNYPNGIHIDVSQGKKSCMTALPYPAKRCGQYYVECQKCGTNALVTTAGRVDDPKSVRLPCKGKESTWLSAKSKNER
jgi:hypothetical protein